MRAQVFPVAFASIYLLFLLSMLSPSLQAHFLFLHKMQVPFRPDFDNPVRYGIAPYKTRNLRLTTSDRVQIGAWHVLPDQYMKEHRGPFDEAHYDKALQKYPTVVYLHGNAANRAAPFRTATYSLITSRLGANVVAIDYRGFGDSEGSPSEEGLVRDARAAWDWVLEKRAGKSFRKSSEKGAGMIVMGQSLGTGVAAKLSLDLTQGGTPPQGVVLIAPYSSIRGLITSYRIGGIFPVFAPLSTIPFANKFLDRVLYTHFNTSAVLPILLSATRKDPPTTFPRVVVDHATNDEVIPYSHSEQLFDELIALELGSDLPLHPYGSNRKIPKTGDLQSVSDKLKAYHTRVQAARASKVKKRTIEGFGTVETMVMSHGGATAGASDSAEDAPTVTLIRTHHGGHNRVGEGVIDLAGELIGIIDSSASTASAAR
ncbi:alpha/beta-hydrolase [Tilletiaria anomala UBC 951]|uniref:Alpha/beta-hydrolase n=1 Tax=Tilletiaria anomala (strain ATCC 24038 / CBS 436.72 / UBC 951) TaxID=1037660 RepID=A0A066WGT1_TILAU|nr:alpha/beta-hydrolase [Tilletiaria anomala UBC 951]KDN53011.1 alpha/beta-hydrolase [Tilletiaria anomala UBC 951]